MHSSDDMMSEQFKPVVKTLSDAVADNLKQLIKSGRYKSGDKLPSEPELMQQFGVGRSSIREAVRILSNCGLVDVKQGLGTFVNLNEGLDEPLHQRLKRAEESDLKEVRRLLEVKAAEKAAINRTQKDVAKMTSLLKKRKIAAEKGQTQASIELDIEFHNAVADASGNEILADLYRTISIQIKKMFIVLLEDTSKLIEKHQLHEDLLQSIIDKNSKKALHYATRITEETVLS